MRRPPPPVEDRWDFYPCYVDDHEASIFLNLWWEARAPYPGASWLYWLRVDMIEPADHGMGGDSERAAFKPIEDAIERAAWSSRLYYVGRLRTQGYWQLVFYGARDGEEALAALARLAEGREVETGSKHDPEWTYYREFLLPSAERRRWMLDGRVVEALERHGDPLDTPRRVDHWIYFATADARDAFVAAAERDGFTREPTNDGDRFAAQVHRIDPVEHEHIHEVVMKLVALAARHGGAYDGWETSVENPRTNPNQM